MDNNEKKSNSMEMFKWTEKSKGTIHVSYKWRWGGKRGGRLGEGFILSCI